MRFVDALAASLALHAGILGIPAGSLEPVSASDAITSMAASKARLVVFLDPHVPTAPTKPLVPPAASVASSPSTDRNRTVEGGNGNPSVRTAGSRASSLGVSAPRYYDAREVSRRAQAIGDIASLPPRLESIAGSGRLILVLRIAETGKVDRVDIDQSSLDEPVATALAAQFRALRFHPAEIDGVAVNTRMRIEVIVSVPGS